MHEYAITKELLRTLKESSLKNNSLKILKIQVEIGFFSGYASESIKYYFDELKIKEDILKNAEISFVTGKHSDIKIKSVSFEDEILPNSKFDISLKAKNEEIARKIKSFLDSKSVFCINIMGAPGSGKTTLIECLSDYIKEFSVIQGDLKSDVDTKRLLKKNIPSFQINTHSGCHLNAAMIFDALQKFEIKNNSYMLIENVGNLVCPAGVVIGQHLNLLVTATTEGPDKAEKYPFIFKDADAIILMKYDLKNAVEFNEEEFFNRLRKNNLEKPVFKVSKKDLSSIENLVDYLKSKKEEYFSYPSN